MGKFCVEDASHRGIFVCSTRTPASSHRLRMRGMLIQILYSTVFTFVTEQRWSRCTFHDRRARSISGFSLRHRISLGRLGRSLFLFLSEWYYEKSFVNARREGLEFSGSELFEKLSSVLGIFEAVFAWRRALESGCWASRAAGFRSPGCIGSPTGHAPAARAPARRRRGAHACCASDGAAAVPRIPQEAQAFQPSQTRGRVRARGAAGARLRDGRLGAVVFLGA